MSEGEFKVTDKRMFTAEGELRRELEDPGAAAEDVAPSRSAGTASRAPAGAGRAQEPSGPARIVDPATGEPSAATTQEPEAPGPGPGLLELVAVLADPLPLLLGDAALPDGGSAENLEAARFYIDLIEVLQRKTEGNRTAQESQALQDLLYNLRMRFVEKQQG